MAIFLTMWRASDGDFRVVPEEDRDDYLADGYADFSPPWVELLDDLGAYDSGPTWVIAHTDGRRYAATFANFRNHHFPVGFTLERLEVPDIFARFTDEHGDYLTDHTGRRLGGY